MVILENTPRGPWELLLGVICLRLPRGPGCRSELGMPWKPPKSTREEDKKGENNRAHDSLCIIDTWIVQSLTLTLTSAPLLLPSGVRPHLGKLIGCVVCGPILGLLDTSKEIIHVLQLFQPAPNGIFWVSKTHTKALKLSQHKSKTTEHNQFDYGFIPVGQPA